jgi:hypothetical protein
MTSAWTLNLITNVIGVALTMWCSQDAKAVGRSQWLWLIATIFIYLIPIKIVLEAVVMLAGSDCYSTLPFPSIVSTLAGIGTVIWVHHRYLRAKIAVTENDSAPQPAELPVRTEARQVSSLAWRSSRKGLMYKSVKAVVLGFLASFVWILFATAVLQVLVRSGNLQALSPSGDHLSRKFFLTLEAASFVGSLISGWVTAKLAPYSPVTHALVVGLLGGAISMGRANPFFIRLIQFGSEVAAALLGAWLCATHAGRFHRIAKLNGGQTWKVDE